MLTLLLLVGAVICSPVPSDNPTLAAHDAAHVEVTHEVHHVTFEVSEEVSEATASSQAPNGEPPEDDPPIPTATTPPTTPEDEEQKNQFQGVGNAKPLESQTDAESHKNLPEDGQSEDDVLKEDGASVSHKEAQEAGVTKDLADGVHKGLSDVTYEGVSKENSGSEEVAAGVNVSEGETVHEDMLKEVHHEPDRIAEHITEVIDSSSPRDIVERSDAAPEFATQTPHETRILGLRDPKAETRRKFRAYISLPEDSSEMTQSEKPTAVEKVENYKNSESELIRSGLEIMSLTSPTPEAPSEGVPTEDMEGHGEGQEEEVPPADVETEATVVFEDSDFEENSTVVAESENPEEKLESESDAKPEVESEVLPETASEVVHEAAPEAAAEAAPEAAAEATPEAAAEATPEAAAEATPEAAAEAAPEAAAEAAPEAAAEATPEAAAEATPEAAAEAMPEVVPEEVPEMAPEVPETISQPSPTPAPLPGEEYTDSYNDPIDSGGLPDVDVTKEEFPSQEYPQPEVPAEEPSHPQDQSEKVDGGDSSDLAASDHMMEVEAGTAWVLPPQQEQVSAVAPEAMTPGCIVGIVFGVLLSLIVLLGVGGFVIWQRRTLNRPKVLGSDRGYAGSDSGGYIDDQVRVSYVNSEVDTPKGSPEDLISLDNDSFLNSLESMTIQNLWTDNIRHTKL